MEFRCEQCGREGSREFSTLGGFWRNIEGGNEPTWIPFITVCANRTACQKRWPKRSEDEVDRMYA